MAGVPCAEHRADVLRRHAEPVAQHAIDLGDHLHVGIFDAVVDRLDEVAGAVPSFKGIIIDGGNSDYTDTERRQQALASRGLSFLGMGVSGGAEGARNGPSIMVGGKRESYQAVEKILLSIAAKYQNDPCCAWLGPGGAGHFVKTIHNGIEYADMQMIAEVYGCLLYTSDAADE